MTVIVYLTLTIIVTSFLYVVMVSSTYTVYCVLCNGIILATIYIEMTQQKENQIMNDKIKCLINHGIKIINYNINFITVESGYTYQDTYYYKREIIESTWADIKIYLQY